MVEARRSVTAGHGPVTTGRPVRGHGRHAQSSLRVESRPSRRRAGGPALYRSPRRSLAHETPACATEVVIAPGGTSRHVRVSRPLLPRLRLRRYPRDLAATLRSRLRSKMSQGKRGQLPGSSCHTATGARIVPWQQPGDWAINSPDRVSFAPSPTLPVCTVCTECAPSVH
jgi:hypothetical protein